MASDQPREFGSKHNNAQRDINQSPSGGDNLPYFNYSRTVAQRNTSFDHQSQRPHYENPPQLQQPDYESTDALVLKNSSQQPTARLNRPSNPSLLSQADVHEKHLNDASFFLSSSTPLSQHNLLSFHHDQSSYLASSDHSLADPHDGSHFGTYPGGMSYSAVEQSQDYLSSPYSPSSIGASSFFSPDEQSFTFSSPSSFGWQSPSG